MNWNQFRWNNFIYGGEKMRNASAHEGENERQWKKKCKTETFPPYNV